MILLSGIVLIGLLWLGFFVNEIFAEEPIPTTYSEAMNEIIFDGKWTFTREWKESSLNSWILNDGSNLVLRTAHDGNYIYILVDYLSDVFKDKGTDRATVCFGDPDHNKIANERDYCFLVTLGDNSPIVLQGGSPFAISGNFKKIHNTEFVGVGTMSDNADRYTPVPHASYEFKIPLELIGRNNEYSFYLSVYDYHRNITNTWPRDITLESNFVIPSPIYWGTFYSPDSSLPEFHFPYFVFCVPILMIVILGMKRCKLVNFS